jgi:predicted nucleotidyltransferase
MLPDWIELCRLFSAKGVDFLLIGGQAVIAHGYPRLTKDMDLWLRPTAENGQRVLNALTAFGTPFGDLVAERFTGPDLILMLGREPFRVDLLTHIPGVVFEDAWPRRVSITLDGETIPLIAREDLITNKKAVGRLQDLADVEALEAIAPRQAPG